jgi:hypothetical protein
MRESLKAKADIMISVYSELQRSYRWSANDITLRFAALVYAISGKQFDFPTFDRTVRYIRKSTGYFSPYRSTLLFPMAAQLIAFCGDPYEAFDEVLKIDRMMINHGFLKASYIGNAAYAIMKAGSKEDTRTRVIKAHDIYRLMKNNHSWLTGPDDYVSAALLASEPGTARELTAAIESYYRALRKEGFWMSNGLQFLSHLLVFSRKPAAEAASLCRKTADFLKLNKLSVSAIYYGAIGLLSLLNGESGRALDEVVETVDYMKKNKDFRWFFKEMNVLMISSLVGNEYVEDKKKQTDTGSAAAENNSEILAAVQTAAIIAVSSAVTTSVVMSASTS